MLIFVYSIKSPLTPKNVTVVADGIELKNSIGEKWIT